MFIVNERTTRLYLSISVEFILNIGLVWFILKCTGVNAVHFEQTDIYISPQTITEFKDEANICTYTTIETISISYFFLFYCQSQTKWKTMMMVKMVTKPHTISNTLLVMIGAIDWKRIAEFQMHIQTEV